MTKKTSARYSPEVRARAVRMVFEHQGDHASQWKAICSIAAKMGCTGETLRKWVRQAERDQGLRDGTTSEERDRLTVLERENRELRQANEILRKAVLATAMIMPWLKPSTVSTRLKSSTAWGHGKTRQPLKWPHWSG